MSSSSDSDNEDHSNNEGAQEIESDNERVMDFVETPDYLLVFCNKIFQFQSKIREELSSMSFEDLIKLKQKLGAKVYNATVFGNGDRTKRPVKKEFKRENKNRPREMSSKRPVPLLGNEKTKTSESTTTVRDPRFDPKCGEFNATKFKENFSFVADIKAKELSELKSQLKESDDPKEIKKLKFLIQRMQNQNVEEKKRKQREQLLDEEKQEMKRAKMEMKMPHYSSNSKFSFRSSVLFHEHTNKHSNSHCRGTKSSSIAVTVYGIERLW